MPSTGFEYDEEKLINCANYSMQNNTKAGTVLESSYCHELFNEHQSFYKRLEKHRNTLGRFEIFVNNVVLVYQHSYPAQFSSTSTSVGRQYKVTLNHFSDFLQHELPLYEKDDYSLPTESEIYEYHSGGGSEQTNSHEINNSSNEEDVFYVEISPPLDVNNELSRSLYSKHKLHRLIHDEQHSYLRESWTNGHIKEKHEMKHSSQSFNKHIVSIGDFKKDQYDWKRHLNWATEDNPDGVAIVNPASDQGSCGSCWAFAATGSLEACASRNAATAILFETIPDILTSSSSWNTSKDSLVKKMQNVIKTAQIVEAKAFNISKLSVQELVDCDTNQDEGCTGGNPVMAFPFIHKYGLVSSNQYPYEGEQNECKKKYLQKPIASTVSWGILKPDDEHNMELALRRMGPISVGFNGGDPLFLAYSGGIFDSDICKSHPNHAMLVVGYGQEKSDSGEVLKYWIARNSWGTSWGENGYVRIKRKDTTNSTKTSGVCGIGRNPSIAIGGYLIQIDDYIRQWQAESLEEPTKKNYIQNGDMLSDRISLTMYQTPITDYDWIKTTSFLVMMAFVFLFILVLKSLWHRKKTPSKPYRVVSNPRFQIIDTSEEQTNFLNNTQYCYQYGTL